VTQTHEHEIGVEFNGENPRRDHDRYAVADVDGSGVGAGVLRVLREQDLRLGSRADIGAGMAVRVLEPRWRVRARLRGADHHGGAVCVAVAATVGGGGVEFGKIRAGGDRGSGADVLGWGARRERTLGGDGAGGVDFRVDPLCRRLEVGGGVVVSVRVSSVHDTVEFFRTLCVVPVANFRGRHLDRVPEIARA